VWHGEGAATVVASATGATCWRFDFASPPAGTPAGVSSRQKLSAPLATLPAGELLLRGDSVAFPPGRCAHPHRHQGPGIRCLLAGGIRIDTAGRSTSYGPGGAWYESGPEPVFAQAADRPSRFIRVMILPRALLGKSSLQFVDAADAGKPRVQQYKIFAGVPIARPQRGGGGGGAPRRPPPPPRGAAPRRPPPPPRGGGGGGGGGPRDKIHPCKLTPSPPLPRKRGRERTECEARKCSSSPRARALSCQRTAEDRDVQRDHRKQPLRLPRSQDAAGEGFAGTQRRSTRRHRGGVRRRAGGGAIRA